MTRPQLFTKEQAPRAPRQKLMHVVDAGYDCIELECSRCGHNTGFIEMTETVTRYKRGIPCPKCSPKDTKESDQ